MPVEFLGIAGTNPASEVTPRTDGALDLEYTAKLARAHEDNGWDRIQAWTSEERISFGGSSAAAYAVGASEADIFALWGEPLAGTKEQLATIDAEAAKAGRKDRPAIQIAFRPILAETEELAWEKAERILGRIKSAQATTSAFGSSPPAATTSSTTPSTSAAT